MKFRYLVIAGPAEARRGIARRPGFASGEPIACRADCPAFEVWAPAETPSIVSVDRSTVLIGFAFDRASGHALSRAPAAKTEPSDLVALIWGGYAFVAATVRGHRVVRDPSGTVPVYHRREADCDIYASDEHLLRLDGSEPPRPDLEFIAQWLSAPNLRTARTGTVGVRELLPGQCRIVDDDRGNEIVAWSPQTYLPRSGERCDFEDAARALRADLLHCIPRMAPAGALTYLKLSGGLDSSLVAATLASAGRQFAAVNFATRDAEGDERRFARAVAEHCKIELLELEEQPFAWTAETEPTRLRPPRQPLLKHLQERYRQAWIDLDAGLVIDGGGGDNVFAYLATASPVLDAWKLDGAGAAWNAVRDLAAMHELGFWTVLGHAWRRAQRRSTWQWPRNLDFLGAAGVASEVECHPWLQGAGSMLPGSIEHLKMIVGIFHFLDDPHPDAPAVVRPLLAQPIVERCLGIPSHLWIKGGRDRAIARRAVSALLPQQIVRRRGKGGLGAMFRAQFAVIREQLAALLVNGRLADAGIVDRTAIAGYLGDPARWSDARSLRLLEIAAAEQWLRSFG